MAADWYCKIMGSEYGPMSQEELIERIRMRQIGPEDLVRRNSSEWLAVFEVDVLMVAANAPEDVDSTEIGSADDESSAGSELTQPITNESDWYCLATGEKRGPMRFDELQDLVRQGFLHSKDRVWRTSRPKFKPAGEIMA